MRNAFIASLSASGIAIFGMAFAPVFAATRTASIAVSANVVASCNVTPGVASPAGGSGQLNWKAATSVKCSLPVPYQVVINRSVPSGNSASSFEQIENVSDPRSAQPRSFSSFRLVDIPSGSGPWTDNSGPATSTLPTFGSAAGFLEVLQGRIPETDYAGIVVTVIY